MMRVWIGHRMLDAASVIRAFSTLVGWFVIATLVLVVVLLAVSGGAAGPHMTDAIWGGALIAVSILVGGRVVLARLLQSLAWRVLPQDAKRRGPRWQDSG